MKTEVVVAVISGIVAIVSATIAYQAERSVAALDHSFKSKHEREMENLRADLMRRQEREMTLLRTQLVQQHERQKPFLERQMDLYFEAVEVTAAIANLEESAGQKKLETRFWQLYWGALAVVEDQAVVNAMVSYGDALKGLQRSKLKGHSIALAHACRDSLQKLWNTDLGKLVDKRTTQ